MKLNKPAKIMFSDRGYLTPGIIYSRSEDRDIADGLIDNLIDSYGDRNVNRITAESDKLVIWID